MANSPYTQKRFLEQRGPSSSDDYNMRVEENFKDLVYLYNKIENINFDVNNGFVTFVKDLMGLSEYLNSFEARLVAQESINNSIAFTTTNQIDNSKFNATTGYSINTVDQLTYHAPYDFITLPYVSASSMSKLKFINSDGTISLPSSLEMIVLPVTSTADNSTAVIDTAQPFNALLGKAGKIWERNVITSTINAVDGAQCYLYIKIPNDVSAISQTNSISFTPFPLKSVDILEIAYSTDVNIALSPTGPWTALNKDALYVNTTGAAGNIVPGAWAGDAVLDAGPMNFYFDPIEMTAIRIKFRQQNYYNEGSKYIYSYGLSKLDVRYDKFLDTGKTMIRFDALAGKTISHITSITPQMWNVPEYLVGTCFTYKAIWETSFGSSTYTETPVPFSKRVWIEVTLNKLPDGGSPVLSGLILKYT